MASKTTPESDRGGQAMRDQEVTRANRELAAYFKGRRTEREARAALKIIKAFVRDRERQDAKKRAPLPGFAPEPKPAPPKSAARKRRAAKPKSKSTPERAVPPPSDAGNPGDPGNPGNPGNGAA